MWKSTLLKLYDAEVRKDTAKDAIAGEVLQQAPQLKMEHSCQNIRPVFRFLAREESCSDFWPGWVGKLGYLIST